MFDAKNIALAIFIISYFLFIVLPNKRTHINPSLFLFGLLIGASLGGNITPIGASANIVACRLR